MTELHFCFLSFKEFVNFMELNITGFEDVALVQSFKNKNYASVVHKLNSSFFEDKSSKIVFSAIQNHLENYSVQPSIQSLGADLRQRELTESELKGVAEKLQMIHSQPIEYNDEWLKDATEKWGKHRSSVLAVNECRDIIHGLSKKPQSAIVDVIENAINFTLDDHISLSYWDDHDILEQANWYHAPDTKYSSDLETLNKLTKGGVGKKTLNIFLAGINVGKTTWLLNQAVSMMYRGYNVLYATAEMQDKSIRQRMDAKVLQMSTDDILKLPPEKYVELIKSRREQMPNLGHLFIHEWGIKTASAKDVERLVKLYKAKFGITIDFICVDYLGTFKSHTLPNAHSVNSNDYGRTLAEEFRAMAQKLNIAIWSASQLNRDGQDNDEVTIKHIAESIGIMAVSDFVIAGMRSGDLIAKKLMKGRCLKNRYANRNAIKEFVFGLDDDTQTFYDVDSSTSSNAGVDTSELMRLATASSNFGVESGNTPNLKYPDKVQTTKPDDKPNAQIPSGLMWNFDANSKFDSTIANDIDDMIRNIYD